MSVETWKFMAMCVITVNLKQVMPELAQHGQHCSS